ncbi:MAG: DUF2461 domain-containing protein [Deltaproteobacteria bacterium]|nr:DUF2461 domain-containing protein [Deltaproteobacteria bacterium]
MPLDREFQGFSPQAVDFYVELTRNNNKGWFESHKDTFETHVLAPARAFVVGMGERLRNIAPGIHADPRVNRSLFRIQRDIRFSPDKSPYKTHLGIWMWEGEGPRMERPGFYFHLEPPFLMLAAGMREFSKPVLEAYRSAAVDREWGAALKDAIESVTSKGSYIVGERHYKKVPRGFDPHHANAELLLHNGLTVRTESPIPPEFYSEELLDYCFVRFVEMKPVHEWLFRLLERMDA